MHRKRRRQGISLGTVAMLALSMMVLGGMMRILPRFMGDAHIVVDARSDQQTLFDLSALLPAVMLNDIPLGTQEQPGVTSEITAPVAQSSSEPVQQSPAPTLSPTEAPVAIPPQVTATLPATPHHTLTLTIGGSINMDDAVRKSGYYSDSKKYNYDEALSLITNELQSDIVLLSLENLVLPDSKVSDLIAPETILTALAQSGVDMIALGFPRAYEQGLSGIVSTLEAAQRQKLQVIGAYASEEEASRATIVPVNQLQVAFLHYTESLSTKSKTALNKEGSSFAIPMADEARFKADIANARRQGAQIVVVSMNWGGSGKGTPTKQQITLAQQLANAGADIIVGTGTRVVQPVAWLTGTGEDGRQHQTLCAYSLGSLLNESRKDGNVASMLLQLTLSVDPQTGAVSFERTAYTPTYIWRYTRDNQSYYRVVASDKEPPVGMSDDQARFKDNAYAYIQKKLDGVSVTLR